MLHAPARETNAAPTLLMRRRVDSKQECSLAEAAGLELDQSNEERRVACDGFTHTRGEFLDQYGAMYGQIYWEEALPKHKATLILKGFLQSWASGYVEAQDVASDAAEVAMAAFEDSVAGFKADKPLPTLLSLRALAGGVKSLLCGMENILYMDALAKQGVFVALDKLSMPTEIDFSAGELYVNRKDIGAEVEITVESYEAFQWQEFGGAVGDLVTKQLQSCPGLSEYARLDAAAVELVCRMPHRVRRELATEKAMGMDVAILVEVLKGFAGRNAMEVKLLHQSTAALGHFEGAVGYFEVKTLASVVQALNELADGAETLRASLGDVSTGEEDARRLATALDLMRSPRHVVFHVGRALLVNSTDVTDIVERAALAHAEARWEDFGTAVRDLAEELLAEDSKVDKATVMPQFLSSFSACCPPQAGVEGEAHVGRGRRGKMSRKSGVIRLSARRYPVELSPGSQAVLVRFEN